MYEKLLSSAGLSPNESAIYEILLAENGQKAGKIAKTSPLKRALVYKILDDLVAKGLAVRTEPAGKVAVFSAVHPDKLRELAQERAQEAETARQNIESLVPQLASAFNLAAGKPGVRFFEGEEGIKKVWWDSLMGANEILTYGDLEFLSKNFEKLNNEYLKERIKHQIKKRAITNDSDFNRRLLAGYDNEFTETRVIKNFSLDFNSVVMQIYNNKISFTALAGNSKIGVIIEDPLIYKMQKNLFEYLWNDLAAKEKQKSPRGGYEMTNLDKYGPVSKKS